MTTRRVVENVVTARGQRWVVLDGPAAGHVRHGQYARLTVGEHGGWFALASMPGSPSCFLVKGTGGAAGALGALPVGAPVEVGDAQGGFALAPDEARPIVAFAAGSGLGAVRSLVHAFPTARLYYGERTPDDLALADDRRAWRDAGRLVEVLSAADADWSGARGRVYDAATADGLSGPFVAAVCGPAALAAEIAARWPEATVLLNV